MCVTTSLSILIQDVELYKLMNMIFLVCVCVYTRKTRKARKAQSQRHGRLGKLGKLRVRDIVETLSFPIQGRLGKLRVRDMTGA